jgi:hypothetical protein
VSLNKQPRGVNMLVWIPIAEIKNKARLVNG